MFLNKSFNTRECPISCEFYKRDLNYKDFEKICPVSERACSYEAIWLEHRIFLGSKEDMEDIAKAFRKVKENLDEII